VALRFLKVKLRPLKRAVPDQRASEAGRLEMSVLSR